MTEHYAQLISTLKNEAYAKRLNYESLAQVNPDELPAEEALRYTVEYNTALCEWRRACMFLNTAPRSMFDASTIIALLTAKDLRMSGYTSFGA